MNRFTQVLQSVLGALLGVQSRAQWEHDAAQKHPWWHLLAGVVLTVLVVITLMLIVLGVLV